MMQCADVVVPKGLRADGAACRWGCVPAAGQWGSAPMELLIGGAVR